MAQGIKFYTDEHVAKAVIRGLRQRGVDVLNLSEAKMLGASDQDHLARARAEMRVVFTHDAHFLRLHAQGADHAGVVFASRQMSVGETIHGLMLICQLLSAEDMMGHVEFL